MVMTRASVNKKNPKPSKSKRIKKEPKVDSESEYVPDDGMNTTDDNQTEDSNISDYESSDEDKKPPSKSRGKAVKRNRKSLKKNEKSEVNGIKNGTVSIKTSHKAEICSNDDDDDDNDDDDWEEVKDNDDNFDPDSYNPELPSSIQITLQNPTSSKKCRDKWEWIRQCIRCDINHQRKDIQLNAHVCHLLLFVYRLKYLNSIINDLARALVMSSEFYQRCTSKKLISPSNICKWFAEFWKIFKTPQKTSKDICEELVSTFISEKITSTLILNLIIVSFIRLLGRRVRLCYLLCPVPIKPLDLLTKKTKFIKNKPEPILVQNPKISDHECYWVEIFDPKGKKWIAADFVNEIFDNPLAIAAKRKRKMKNFYYVFAIDNEGFVNDVTQRYSHNWFSHDRMKNRVEDESLNQILSLVRRSKPSIEEQVEKLEFEKMTEDCKLPCRISEYKNHPLFVLEKDILKFQALYPPNLPPIGFYNDQPVYPRDCVYTLKSRETWLRDARTVKLNEKAYKTVLSKFKKKKSFSNTEPEREQLELFGKWQTIPYEPPEAKNGIVPRNAFGNVDLFKSCMLPKGTVLLRLPGIARIAAKMNIDCAPAVIGFDNNKKGIGFHPILDGFVVCKEFEQKLVKAWKEQNDAKQEKVKEDREKRIYGNWRRLIRNLILRHNLKIKYGS